MRTHGKLILMALTAALLLSFAAGTASARNGLIASPSTVEAIFPELTFSDTTGLVEVICEVTLNVTFHESVAKTIGSLAGFAEVAVDEAGCEGGTAGLLDVNDERVTGLYGPYHITFDGFTGTLPNIQSVSLQLNEVKFWIEAGVTCLANEQPISGTSSGGNPATELDVIEANVPLEGGILCNLTSGKLDGSAALTHDITIELI